MFDSAIHSFGNMIKCMKYIYIYIYISMCVCVCVKREIKKAKRTKKWNVRNQCGLVLEANIRPQKVIDDFIFIIKLYVLQ